MPSYDEYMTMKDCVKKEFEAVEKYAQLKETITILKNKLLQAKPELEEWVEGVLR